MERNMTLRFKPHFFECPEELKGQLKLGEFYG